MADDQKDTAEAPEGGSKPSKKLLIIVGAVMALEGALVAGFMMMTGGPADATAAQIEGEDMALREQLVEIDVASGRYQNMHGESNWLWDTEIKIKVREKNREYVTQQLEERNGEINEGISMIFRKAQPSQLKEPGLETLKRQITALLEDIFGMHPDGTPRIDGVLIPKCTG
ncbi:MAG: hypothetical protein KDB18_09570, partial [Salinibacterium sp.]|nr:hypothetical protein [Salinibacterium sp.]